MYATRTLGWAGLAVLVSMVVSYAQPARSETLFRDGFESGDFSATSGGFMWGSPNKTSIVRDDGFVVNNGKVIMNGPFPDRLWESRPGSGGRHAMRFRYPSGDTWAEQRFAIGGAYRELWMSFWLRIPINFDYSAGSNNKLFMVWMDGYSTKGDGSTVGMEMRPTDEVAGGVKFYVKISKGRYDNLGGDTAPALFAVYPRDQGRWMQLVVRMKAETSEDAGDGLMQVWRRWEDESSFSMTHDVSGVAIRVPTAGPQGFSAGYLLGWANGPFAQDTEYLLDDFELSTSSLLGSVSVPKAPKEIKVQ